MVPEETGIHYMELKVQFQGSANGGNQGTGIHYMELKDPQRARSNGRQPTNPLHGVESIYLPTYL